MKKILYAIILSTTFIVSILMFSSSASALSIGWNRYLVGGLRPLFSNDDVLIGGTATTSLAQLEVQGDTVITGNLGLGITDNTEKLNVQGEVVGQFFNATSTTATSTIAGGLNVGSGGLVYDRSTGKIGLGTASPDSRLSILDNGVTGSTIVSIHSDDNVPFIEEFYNDTYSAVNPAFSYYLENDGEMLMGTRQSTNFSFVTNGYNTRRMTITGGGNVGIANNSPSARLVVTNTGTGSSFLVEDSANPDSTPFIIDASGNVGIGTASPGAKLDVVGGDIGTNLNNYSKASFIQDGSIIAYAQNLSGAKGSFTGTVLENVVGAFGGQFVAYDDSTNPDWLIGMSKNTAGPADSLYYMIDSSGSKIPFAIHKTGAIGMGGFDAENNPNVTLTSTGRLGIGTTSPASLLDVYSTATTTVTWDSSSVTQGACIKIKDFDGGGYTYLTTLNGVATFSTISCE